MITCYVNAVMNDPRGTDFRQIKTLKFNNLLFSDLGVATLSRFIDKHMPGTDPEEAVGIFVQDIKSYWNDNVPTFTVPGVIIGSYRDLKRVEITGVTVKEFVTVDDAAEFEKTLNIENSELAENAEITEEADTSEIQ